MGMTIRRTKDGSPKSQLGGSYGDIIIDDVLQLDGFDLSQAGLRDRTVPYPSEYVDALAELFWATGDQYFVRWNMPTLAAAHLELSKALKLGSQRKLELDSARQPIFIHDDFERHARRAVHMFGELYPGKLSWYMWQLLGSVVHQMRRLKVLGPYTQGPMEHVQQDVGMGVKRSNGGANVGRMTNEVRADLSLKPAYMEERKEGVMDPNQSLWRRLFTKTLASTKSLRQADPEVSYAGAHGIIAHLRIVGREMEHDDFDSEWSVTEGFIKYLGRWRRIAKMGSRLRSEPHTRAFVGLPADQPPHAYERASPRRTCAATYAETLASCAHLMAGEAAERARAAAQAAPRRTIFAAAHEKGGLQWRVGMLILIEIFGGVAFIMEILKTKHGRGRGRWGPAALQAAVAEARRQGEEMSRPIERVDLIVRTHRPDGTTYEPTDEARQFYDDTMLEVVTQEECMLPGCSPIEDQQEYRSAEVDELLEVLENDFGRMPSDVSIIRSHSCRASKGTWYESDGMEAVKAHHRAVLPEYDGDAQYAPPGAPWTLRSVQPRRGKPLCMYFCVPRADDDVETEDMETE